MPIQLIIGVVAFLAVAGVIGGAYHTVKKSGYTEAEAEYKPKLEACAGEVDKQNKAVAAMAEETARRQAASAQALSKATVKAKAWEDNAVRLQGVLAGRKPDGDKSCAGAWGEIRKPK